MRSPPITSAGRLAPAGAHPPASPPPPLGAVTVSLEPDSTTLIGARIERLSRWVDNNHYRVLLHAQVPGAHRAQRTVLSTPAINVMSKVVEKRKAPGSMQAVAEGLNAPLAAAAAAAPTPAPDTDASEHGAPHSAALGAHGGGPIVVVRPMIDVAAAAGSAVAEAAAAAAAAAATTTAATMASGGREGAGNGEVAGVGETAAAVGVLQTERAQLEHRVAELRQQSTELARRVQESARLLLLVHTQLQNKQRELDVAAQQHAAASSTSASDTVSLGGELGSSSLALSSFLLPEAFDSTTAHSSGPEGSSQAVSLSLDPSSFGFTPQGAVPERLSGGEAGRSSGRSRASGGRSSRGGRHGLGTPASRRTRRRLGGPRTPDHEPALLADTMTTSPLLWWSPGGGGVADARSPGLDSGHS